MDPDLGEVIGLLIRLDYDRDAVEDLCPIRVACVTRLGRYLTG